MATSYPEPETVEPTLRTLEQRLTELEQQITASRERVETYTREKPLMALGIAFIAGYFIGRLLSK